ncbi:hypothetical protein GCM10010449_38520 [Streptomyces rectiviolaceus]|uniref:Uncharacterized protein n=1 Tax=Streptomyces rectiviolaceus TaxID=332591 RepID=A0ABP6MGK0_9ACTN
MASLSPAGGEADARSPTAEVPDIATAHIPTNSAAAPARNFTDCSLLLLPVPCLPQRAGPAHQSPILLTPGLIRGLSPSPTALSLAKSVHGEVRGY